MSIIVEMPTWLRVFNVLAGIFYIIIASLVILNPGITQLTLIFLLAIILFAMGVVRILNGVFIKHLEGHPSKFIRLLRIIVGIFLCVLAIAVGVFPELGIIFLLALLGIGLVANGAARFSLGIADTTLPKWLRIALLILGLASMVLGFFVILFPNIGEVVLIFLLAFGFVVNGIARIFIGIAGYEIIEPN